MSKNVALLLVLVFLTASSMVAVKPAFSSDEIVEDTWTAKASMNHARAGLGVGAVNGKIYAIGGTTAGGQYPPDVSKGGFVGTNEEYDPATDKWITKASMPTPRDYFAIAAYQSKIYCIGGVVGFRVDEQSSRNSYVTTSVNEVYDTVSDTWVTKKSIPFSAEKLLANEVNGKIYVMQEFFMYAYDPINDSWTNKTRMPATPRTWSGATPASFVIGDKICVAGEFLTDDHLRLEQKVLVYDTKTDMWSESQAGPTIIIDGAAGVTGGVNAPQRVYVLGLVSGKFPAVSTNQVYDPETEAWTTANAMPTIRLDFGVAVVNDVLYAIGGYSYTSQTYGMVKPVAVNEQYIPLGYSTRPGIDVLSPISQTYNGSSVSLVFNVNKSVKWLGYSLNGEDNVTISGNTTLTGLPDGDHDIIVYATDEVGNVGASETVTFTIAKAETFPTALLAASIASAALVGVGILVYFKKRKH
jgi:N-acetylneuraminic acid mutarotase